MSSKVNEVQFPMNCLLSCGHFSGQRQHVKLFICGLAAAKCLQSLTMKLWLNKTNSDCLSLVETWKFGSFSLTSHLVCRIFESCMPPLNKFIKTFKTHLKIGLAGRCLINNGVTSLETNRFAFSFHRLPEKKQNKTNKPPQNLYKFQ